MSEQKLSSWEEYFIIFLLFFCVEELPIIPLRHFDSKELWN